MRTFLRHLQRSGENAYHPDELARCIGRADLDTLRALGVVIDAEPARSLPCGNCLDECSREVFEHDTKPGTFVAECGREHDGDDFVDTCEDVEVAAQEVARVRVSLDAFVRVVAKARDLAPGDTQRVASAPVHWLLGRGADARAAIFCASPHTRGFELLLLAQREPTLVLVPSRDGVPGLVSQRYAPGERVEVRFLEDELALRGGHIYSAIPRAAVPALGTRSVIDREGERRVSDADYEQLRTADAELVVDLTATTASGGVPARVRGGDGAIRAVSLPRSQAHALLELVRARGKELRPGELNCMREAQVRDPARLVELMRQEIDVRLGRYEWRAIHTIRGATPEAKAYAFRPPPEMRYAVLVGA